MFDNLFALFVADMNDEQVRMALRQAFITVEKGFFQSIDDALAEKTEIQLQLPEVIYFMLLHFHVLLRFHMIVPL